MFCMGLIFSNSSYSEETTNQNSNVNQAESSDTQQAAVARGAQLWASNCVRCHSMRAPQELNDEEWLVVLENMKVKAGFTGQQIRDMLAFLQASND